jgi:hypothetical protein
VIPVHQLEVFHAELCHAALEVQVVHCKAAGNSVCKAQGAHRGDNVCIQASNAGSIQPLNGLTYEPHEYS